MFKLLLIYFVYSSVLLAQDSLRQDIAVAASIENDLKRLDAFDAITEKYKLAPGTKIKQEREGKWVMRVETSPVDDKKTLIAYVTADSPVLDAYNKMVNPVLILRYKEGQFTSYIDCRFYIGSNVATNRWDVTTRFGKDKATVSRWVLSSDREALFYPGKQSHLIKKLEQVDSLLIRLTPTSQSPRIFSFTTIGIKEVKEAILKTVKDNEQAATQTQK